MTRAHWPSCVTAGPYRCVQDHRTKREKLEDMAASTSPAEAAVARGFLKRLDGSKGTAESARVLTREAVLGSPDAVSGPRRGVRVRYPSGEWMHMYEDEVDWELVDLYKLQYRRDGENETFVGKGGKPNKRPLI